MRIYASCLGLERVLALVEGLVFRVFASTRIFFQQDPNYLSGQ